MADAVVTYLLDNITQLLRDEANLLSGVKEKVELLKQELERINDFLENSEGKRNDEHGRVKLVVRQIRDVAYEAQDVIDSYVVDVITHTKKGTLGRVTDVGHAKKLHKVNDEIEKIKVKIEDIYNNRDKYDINDGESSAAAKMEALSLAETVQRRRNDVEEDEVVGFDEYANQVSEFLLKGEKSRQVVSIVGMVGCGKTTLARKVFRDPQVTTHQRDGLGFEFVAWVSATKEFNAKELLLSLLRSLDAISEDDEDEGNNNNSSEKGSDSTGSTASTQEIVILKRMLRDHLSDARYLVVIDDVWEKQLLEVVGDAFPNDNLGSRILITTRSHEVASKVSTVEPYKLKRLSDEDSWILFSKKVFKGEECPPNLKSTGWNIAKNCEGLPLAIVVIAGILRSKEKAERVWEKVIKDVHWYINQEDKTVWEIVRLSYETLPRRLKPCFLYFGIYPEDYDISVRQLIHLWVAEGFIQQTGHSNMLLEDVAEEYLEDLIRRNLIQVESRRTDGGVKTCKIHDLLRELCLSESIAENFLDIRKDVSILNEGKPRRLSLQCSMSHYISASPCNHSITRSLFCFSKKEYNADDLRGWLAKNFKLVRVVDMGQVEDSTDVVEELQKLILIRYFRARCIGSFLGLSLHKKICSLWNLETFDLRGSGYDSLPNEIWKLKRLRHLYLHGLGYPTELPNIPEKKTLPNLQTLTGVCLNRKAAEQLEKGVFPNLRKLGVNCLTPETLFNYETKSPIGYLQRLQCLSHLNTLKIVNVNGVLESVEGFPPNITKITLVGNGYYLSGIANHLGSLPKLRYLKISAEDSTNYRKFKLECVESGRFPQLQVLKVKGLDCKKWNMGRGGMPQLRRWVINNCRFETSLPSAESFTALQEIEVLWSSKEEVDKLQHLVVKDTCKLTVFPALAE